MQQTSSGVTLNSKYAGLPGSTRPQQLPPEKVLGCVFGHPGCGKSQLFESNADAFIINMDMTSTSNPDPQAVTWPTLDADGVSIDENGKKFSVTWAKIEELIKILVTLSENNSPRPKTIVFDSLTSMINLLKIHAPEGLPMASTTGKDFRELNGKMAWDYVYDTILKSAHTLKQAGYGVWFIAHTKNEDQYDANGHKVGTQIKPTFTPAIWGRLSPNMEIVASVVKSKKFVKQEVTVTIPSSKGPARTKTKTESVEKTVYTLGFKIQDLKDFYKGRAFPEVVLPALGAWSVFRNAYMTELQNTTNALLETNNVNE